MWADILNPAKGFWTGQISNKHKDGHLVNVILTISTIFDSQKNAKYFIAHHVKISEGPKKPDKK